MTCTAPRSVPASRSAAENAPKVITLTHARKSLTVAYGLAETP